MAPFAGSVTITIRRETPISWLATMHSPTGEYKAWSAPTKPAVRKLAEAYASAQNWYVYRVYQ